MSENLYYVGLICGTSLDGIDAVLVEIPSDDEGDGKDGRPNIKLVRSHFATFEDKFVSRMKNLSLGIYGPGEDPIFQLGTLDREAGHLFAQAANQLLAKSPEIGPDRVKAIGSHGITVRHCPAEGPTPSFTLQIGDPNTIAVGTGINVVGDLRRKDLALGGQGAPLVPALHQAIFSHPQVARCIVNIGGISNVTILRPGQSTLGFDTGPGNTLLDAWCHEKTGMDFDRNGEWSQSGQLNPALLKHLRDESYFELKPPKSTGKELFNPSWLKGKLQSWTNASSSHPLSDVDIQCTLVHLTVTTIAEALRDERDKLDGVQEVYVCGGGARNGFLMELLDSALVPLIVRTTNHLGVHSDFVEAMAFAWLAHAFTRDRAGNLPEVTGAKSKAILGGLYKAG
ncbi:hypothetical protein TCAL_10717 [Tigriopus californicus]|uniref:Anhydro-N-acetylmuramic acid kinase n=1 Tax=Tigriopus californicus TaxID=6832 RepID=A0A553N957_TIGCA|nr:anhydro-N-acetylmuramic acid kinase-like [Tigriopus californicus]XP_059089374.1 anhydro-N-acetylmuramic acid kinase-like [Tigriopus californicus]TRY61984.1 hypothetical protein TCAL_10717 [Tigriopus californicus]|eukprot:TCALIF_10717-PA protein Name:"Similar to anmK Anhydro-N-acetylmuramic acid kinase (Shewanella oneidensis (strain MR-1))" AED:0.14 eAED:0.14 QI:0/-1/0/1/-1/1/1/0/396